MAEQHQLPLRPRFPALRPQQSPEIIRWAHEMEEAITDMYRLLAERLEGLVLVNTLANRPAADGSLRFYFATDNTTLYFDDGTWNAV